MGRITIFSVDGCPHCARVMAELVKHNIPFTEINITQFPKKRNDMLSLSSKLSTPQVFFNTRHVGGADDTIQLLQSWADPESSINRKSRYNSPYERYQQEIEKYADPSNPRFEVPDYPPVSVEEAHLTHDQGSTASVVLPDGFKTTVLQVTEALKKMLPISDHSQGITIYTNSFSGAQASQAFMKEYNITEEQAFEFGLYLQESHLLHHVSTPAVRFNKSSSDQLFRLQCHHTPHVLNSYCIWTDPAVCDNNPSSSSSSSPLRLLASLRKKLSAMENAHTENKSGQVDWLEVASSPTFLDFEVAVCALQKVDLGKMDDNTKMAFGINIYNLMVKYAFVKVGIGESSLSRASFFTSVLFDVGGFLFSLQDWENGILRGNKKAPHGLTRPFPKNDSRSAFVLSKNKKPDYRIHFGLNCGARSCPPVHNYNPDDIDEELRIVAQAFCEDDDHVSIDVKKREVQISKIFGWYRSDFASNDKELLEDVLLKHLHGVKRQALEGMQRSKQSIKITYKPYDWSTNAKNYKSFDPQMLKANSRTVRAILQRSSLVTGKEKRSENREPVEAAA